MLQGSEWRRRGRRHPGYSKQQLRGWCEGAAVLPTTLPAPGSNWRGGQHHIQSSSACGFSGIQLWQQALPLSGPYRSAVLGRSQRYPGCSVACSLKDALSHLQQASPVAATGAGTQSHCV